MLSADRLMMMIIMMMLQHADTSPRTVAVCMALMRSMGKAPVLLKKEIPGFIANRLQAAVMREAFHLLQEDGKGRTAL
jgi:3-hydroxybutyryl-CoA dehydrogenase